MDSRRQLRQFCDILETFHDGCLESLTVKMRKGAVVVLGLQEQIHIASGSPYAGHDVFGSFNLTALPMHIAVCLVSRKPCWNACTN